MTGEQAWLASFAKVVAALASAESGSREVAPSGTGCWTDAAQLLRESVTTIALKYHNQPITDPGGFTDEVMDQCAARTQMYEKQRAAPAPRGTDA